MMPTLAVATAHAFVLTVSHDCCSTNPRLLQRHFCRRFSPIHQIPSCGGAPRDVVLLIFGLNSNPNVTYSEISLHGQSVRRVPIGAAARANDVRAEPMKRHNLSTI
jgi:hypothetical protein